MAQICICCGLRPDDFWNLTPWETNALAQAYVETRKLDHKRESWFTAHLMASGGNLKPGTRIKKLIEQLNSPVEKAPEMMEITSLDQLRVWESERAKRQEGKDADGRV